VDGYIVKQSVADPEFLKPGISQQSRLFYYSTAADQSREITPEEAEKIALTSSVKSPEGFEVVHGSYGGFPFGGSDYNSVYLKKGAFSKRLNIVQDTYNYYGFNLLGWVKK
jgi:hypothetical protein